MRTIMAVTVGPSDWGIFRPVLQQIRNDPDLELQLVAGGAHLSDTEGDTLGAILKHQDDIQKLQGSEAKRILDEARSSLETA